MFSSHYTVLVEKFAERHFISKFEKKYRGKVWLVTWNAIEEEFKRIESLIGVNNIVETIVDAADLKICKHEFRVAGTNKSRHASGNRCIIAVRKSTATVHVLLVYSKGDLGKDHETAAWKKIIRDNYPEYSNIIR